MSKNSKRGSEEIVFEKNDAKFCNIFLNVFLNVDKMLVIHIELSY